MIPSYSPSPVRSDKSLRDFRVIFHRCQLERRLALFFPGVRIAPALSEEIHNLQVSTPGGWPDTRK